MRVHATKTLLFPNDNGNIIIKNHEIKDLPDWIADTLTFKLAKEEGSLMVIETKEQKVIAENGVKKKPKESIKNE